MKIGDPNFTYKISVEGMVILALGGLAIVLYTLGFYFGWKITDINEWKNEFFFEEYENKYQAIGNEKIRIYRNIFLATFVITIISFLIAVFVPFEKPDMEYWVVNYLEEAGDYEGFSVGWMQPITIAFTLLSVVSFITHVVFIYKVSDLTCTRYQATIISIYRNGTSGVNQTEPSSINSDYEYPKKSKSKESSDSLDSLSEW